MGIKIDSYGLFTKTSQYLKKLEKFTPARILEKYAQDGVAALSSATPVDTGKTANSWYYEIAGTSSGATIHFLNSNINKGVPIAIILQYGHGTGTGGWVEGVDYINPALLPVFNNMVNELIKEVSDL